MQYSFHWIKKRLPTHCSQRRLVVESIISFIISGQKSWVQTRLRLCSIQSTNNISTLRDMTYNMIRQYYLHPEDFELGVDEDDDDLH